MIKNDKHSWRGIAFAMTRAVAKAETNEHVGVCINHVLHFGNAKSNEAIEFCVQWRGGPHGSVRTEKDMDDTAANIASAMPLRYLFGTADKVEKNENLPHCFSAFVYIK